MKSTGIKLKLAVAGLFCAAVFGLAACGGSDDSSEPPQGQDSADVQAIKEVGTKLKDAYQQGDAAAACALLSPSDLKTQFNGKDDCAKRVAGLIKKGKAKPDVDFTSVDVEGNKATAETGKPGSGRTTYGFVKIGGTWYIKLDSKGSE
jgi:ketosteroid isomerase-like protein